MFYLVKNLYKSIKNFVCVIFELYTRIRPKYGRKKQPSQALLRPSPAVLWNCNYFFTDPVPVPVSTFGKVMVPVPVPTLEKLRFRFRF